MYDYLLSVFLGIVEGLTEFLPVSSTAHLRICEALLHIDLHDGFWKMYTIVIQLGAILALAATFVSGVTLEVSAIRPLYGRSRLDHVLGQKPDLHLVRPQGSQAPIFGASYGPVPRRY